jgi:transposase
VSIIAGTSSEIVRSHLDKIPYKLKSKVEEISLDMSGSMNTIAKYCFPNRSLVMDRYHVQKLAIEAFQEIRIKHRWEAIDRENEAIKTVRKNKNPIHQWYYLMEIQ